ncbi:MAG TPA: hypothetical protein VJ719_07645, partial [Chthoniobacterales bacterium]|nr:hypothetical protein [Chthoniobacterales bacterium]
PIVTVRVSDKWKTQQHGEFIETVSPDGTIHALLLPVEGNKVTEATGEAMRYIRRRGGIMVKAETIKQDQARLKKKKIPMLSWDATEHGHPIKIRCHVFSADDGRRAICMTWGLITAEDKNAKELRRLLDNVQTH